MLEPTRDERLQHALAGMTERGVAEIVAERDRLRQLLVQTQHFRDASRDLRHLERVGEARAVMIARRREEHLRLVLQAAERLAVDDAIAIALKRRTDRILGLVLQASPGVAALRRLRREDLALARLEVFANRHLLRISRRKLVPLGSLGTSNNSASVWPRSANVSRIPMSTPGLTAAPVTKIGTCSLE